MANTLNGNTLYIDTTGSAITNKNVKVHQLIVTSSGVSDLTLIDPVDSTVKLRVKIDATDKTENLELGRPLLFPNGISVGTITNCEATIIIES